MADSFYLDNPDLIIIIMRYIGPKVKGKPEYLCQIACFSNDEANSIRQLAINSCFTELNNGSVLTVEMAIYLA